MDRNSIVATLVAGLGVISLAIVAATLEDRRDFTGDGGGTGDNGFSFGGEDEGLSADYDITVPFLEELLYVLLFFVVIIGLIYIAQNHREALGIVIVMGIFLGLLFLAVEHITVTPPEPMEPENLSPADELDVPENESGGSEEQINWGPIMVAVGLLSLILITAIGLSFRQSGANPRAPEIDASPETARPDVTAAEIGDVAGRAADRIEDDDAFSNEVFRAWSEMTSLLEFENPSVATPRDFEQAAMKTGLAQRDVRELTELFEDVRYGNRSPTAEREEQAIELLRRIERTYGEDR